MTAIEFVKRKIDELVSRFPNISCRYEHDSFSNTHLIEVLPNYIYKSDLDYEQAEVNIIDGFIEKFPYESICFVTDDSLVHIQKPIYERKGITYDIISTAITNDWFTISFINKLNLAFPNPINVNILEPPQVFSNLSNFKLNLTPKYSFYNLFASNKIPANIDIPFYSIYPQFNFKFLPESFVWVENIRKGEDESIQLEASTAKYSLAA